MLPDDLQLKLDAELPALAALAGASGISSDHLRLGEGLARARAKARAAIRAAALASPPPGNGGADPADPASRALGRNDVVFDRAVLLGLLADLRAAGASMKPEEDPLAAIEEAAKDDPALLTTIARAACPGGDARDLQAASQSIGVPAHALLHVGRLLAGPFLAEARLRRGAGPEWDARVQDVLNAGRCPVCASAPDLASLDHEEGRRHLHCSLCEERWLVPRLMCPFCGSRDQDKLCTLFVNKDAPRWIETCDACRRYIKTADLRRLPDGHELVLAAEDVIALPLVLMAEEAGYSRPAF